MSEPNINILNLTKIPEKEFKQHFRDWMEQDEVARSLQAKLRKDLISNFNKTALGKKIISHEGSARRLNLSPVLLAVNTLAAEFLYAQNCHFTLSVFCTEVPYRNTLPDFESSPHFRFSELEVFEIFDALSSKLDKDTKDAIIKEYSKQKNCSLLFIILKKLVSKKYQGSPVIDHPPEESVKKSPEKIQKSENLNSKADYQNNNFRYLNKYLIILSKKVKQMSQNLDHLQETKNARPVERKSLQRRKFENLNRNLEKISENLRQMSISKRKNKRIATLVTSVDTMAKQFERCALNFEQISKGFVSTSSSEKSYIDWIKEMRNTDNGKIFLEKIESALRKTLQRERKKMENEIEQRLQVQKDILKTKYKQKTIEELALYTSRRKESSSQITNELLEKKLNQFEVKHQELHKKIKEAEHRVMQAVPSHIEVKTKESEPQLESKENRTQIEQVIKLHESVDTQRQIQNMVESMSEQERQIDHIVFDAKLRIQELEHESNQLDRSFRDYLDRQRSEKEKMRDNATSILENYSLGKSLLVKKGARFRSQSRNSEINRFKFTPAPEESASPALSMPTIEIDNSVPSKVITFENPFRIAQKKVLTRSKTFPLLSTDTESSAEKCTQYQRKQRPTELRLIEQKDETEEHIQTAKIMSLPGHAQTKSSKITRHSPELNIDDITLEGIEISPSTAKSSSFQSRESNSSNSYSHDVFKLKRQLFTVTKTVVSSSSNGCQMNSNGNKEAEEPLKQINNENDNDEKNFIEGHEKKNDLVNTEIMVESVSGQRKEGEIQGLSKSTGIELVTPSIVIQEDGSSESFHLNLSARKDLDSAKDFWT